MVKFAILLHTIYKRLCVVALCGADGTPVLFCPAQGAVLFGVCCRWRRQTTQQSQLKMFNTEGPCQLLPVQSLRK